MIKDKDIKQNKTKLNTTLFCVFAFLSLPLFCFVFKSQNLLFSILSLVTFLFSFAAYIFYLLLKKTNESLAKVLKKAYLFLLSLGSYIFLVLEFKGIGLLYVALIYLVYLTVNIFLGNFFLKNKRLLLNTPKVIKEEEYLIDSANYNEIKQNSLFEKFVPKITANLLLIGKYKNRKITSVFISALFFVGCLVACGFIVHFMPMQFIPLCVWFAFGGLICYVD